MKKDRIRELREKNNLTMAAFAKSLGISPTSVSLYESGKQIPGNKIIAKICEVYGVDETYFTTQTTGTIHMVDTTTTPAVNKGEKKEKRVEKEKEKKKPGREAKEAVNGSASKIKAKAGKMDIIIQSPMGGAITPEQIAEKIPEETEAVYVRVDENKLYWVKGNENGAVDIW